MQRQNKKTIQALKDWWVSNAKLTKQYETNLENGERKCPDLLQGSVSLVVGAELSLLQFSILLEPPPNVRLIISGLEEA